MIYFRPFRPAMLRFLGTAAVALACCPAFGQEPPAGDAAPPQQPIVLEPSDAPHPPVVQLSKDGPLEPWDPLEIGEFQLVDQLGRPVTREVLKGKPWVASFIFTRCAFACPLMAKKIYDLDRRLRDVDLRFVTITVDPEHDTPERLKQYSEIYAADPDRWLFLTGDKSAIDRLIRHGFKVAAWEQFGTDRLPGFEFAHSLRLVHVGAGGKVLGQYSSEDERELLTLQRVLAGDIETPPANRPIPQTGPPAPPEEPAPSAAAPKTGTLPLWAQRLPRTNASLNALATVLLLVGFTAIKARRMHLHRRMMLIAFGVSVVFLACYLAYHFALHHYTGEHGKRFEGTGAARTVYYGILVSHVVLAAAVPVLALTTIYRAASGQFDRHRRIARITFPIWLYVSVTGVIIYGMLYHW